VAIDLLSFGPERFSSRELSRLEFGARLLDLGGDQRLPILERCKFVAIFADMVDEFFQVRVVSLEDKVAAGVQTPSLDGVRPRQQLSAIRERVMSLMERQDRLVLDRAAARAGRRRPRGRAVTSELDEEERLSTSRSTSTRTSTRS
jgi:polyphosphate kinase